MGARKREKAQEKKANTRKKQADYARRRDAYNAKVRDEDGVSTLRALLDRRDPKVQRAAAAALLALGEHEGLGKEIARHTETLVARPGADRARAIPHWFITFPFLNGFKPG